MKQKWLCIFGVALWVAAAACGGEEVDPLDPSTFAGMNADKIQYDCQQTVQCGVQRGQPQMEDPFDACIRATAEHLEMHPEKQMQFVINVNRCRSFVVCEYTTCALNDMASSWGMMQIEKVTYNCMQDVECRRQQGTLVGEVTAERDSCIANNIGLLDSFNPDQRVQFESEFMRCGMQVACDFSTCFPF